MNEFDALQNKVSGALIDLETETSDQAGALWDLALEDDSNPVVIKALITVIDQGRQDIVAMQDFLDNLNEAEFNQIMEDQTEDFYDDDDELYYETEED